MGLVINPVAFRLGHSITWMDAWYMHRMYYPEFMHNVLLIRTLMFFLFYDLFFAERYLFFVYSHLNLYLKKNRIFAGIHVYDSTDRTFFYNWLNYLNYDKFKKARLKTFWLKKQLLIDNIFGQNFFLLLNSLDIHLDYMLFEDIDVKYSQRLKKKIEILRLRYGKNFIAREEINMLKKLFFFFQEGFYKYGSLYVMRYYIKYYFLKKNKYFRLLNDKKTREDNYFRLFNLKYNYIFLFFVLSIFDLFLSRSSPSYPHLIGYTRLENMYAIRFFFYWFFLRSVYFYFSKFVEITLLKFGLKIYCRFFILNNSCLIALFIARFIALGIYSRFSFKDLMIPIRRSLHRLMYVRVFKRIASDIIQGNIIHRINRLKRDFYSVKNFLKYKISFFAINLLININEILYNYKFLYFKKHWFFYIIPQRKYRFLKIFNFLKFMKCTFAKDDYFNYCLYIFKKKNDEYLIKNYYINNFKDDMNFILKFYNILNFIFFRNFNLINLKFFFNEYSFLIININNSYLKFKMELINNLIFKNFKFIYFLIFKKFFDRLYYFIKFFYKAKNKRYKWRKYFYKILRRKRWITWAYLKSKVKTKDNIYIMKHNRKVFKLLFHFLLTFRKKKKKIKNKEEYKKYKLILNLLETFLSKHNKKVKAFLNCYSNDAIRKLIFLKKIKKIYKIEQLNRFPKLKKWKEKIMLNYKKIEKLKKMQNKAELQRIRLNSIVNRFSRWQFERRINLLKLSNFVKTNLFFFYINKKFITKFFVYNRFPINIEKLMKYMDSLDNVKYLFYEKYINKKMLLKKKREDNEIMTPLKYKLKRRKFLDRNKAILYGYKFHFKGRFKRKQKASNLWFVKGAMPNSTMIQHVDRGFFTFYSMFGACTVRVWLYKSDTSPKYIWRL